MVIKNEYEALGVRLVEPIRVRLIRFNMYIGK